MLNGVKRLSRSVDEELRVLRSTCVNNAASFSAEHVLQVATNRRRQRLVAPPAQPFCPGP